jgi:hypothetical protein
MAAEKESAVMYGTATCSIGEWRAPVADGDGC